MGLSLRMLGMSGQAARGAGRPETTTPTGYQAASLDVRHAVAILRLTTENRSDVLVQIANPGTITTPHVSVSGTTLVIDGGIADRDIRDCGNEASGLSVRVTGIGNVSESEMPVITAKVPASLVANLSGGIRTVISGITASADVHTTGCGSTTIGDVLGALTLFASGSGDTWVGHSDSATISLSGSGGVRAGAVARDLSIALDGSGDVAVQSVSGRLKTSVNGSGDVKILGGQVPRADLTVNGSGNVDIDAPVGDLSAAITGSGDVRARSVSGVVEKRIIGSGDVRVGS